MELVVRYVARVVVIADPDVDAAPPMPPQAPPRSAGYIPDAAELPRMWPTTHPFFGYLLYSAYVRFARGRPPRRGPTLALVVGALLADLIDKPLWLATDLGGRTIGHSLLFAVPVVAAVGALARRRDRPEPGVAFAVGYGSHLLGDALYPLGAGTYHELGSLLWPVTPMPPYEGQKHLATVAGADVTTTWLEVAIVAAALAVWVADGRPGLDR